MSIFYRSNFVFYLVFLLLYSIISGCTIHTKNLTQVTEYLEENRTPDLSPTSSRTNGSRQLCLSGDVNIDTSNIQIKCNDASCKLCNSRYNCKSILYNATTSVAGASINCNNGRCNYNIQTGSKRSSGNFYCNIRQNIRDNPPPVRDNPHIRDNPSPVIRDNPPEVRKKRLPVTNRARKSSCYNSDNKENCPPKVRKAPVVRRN